jgi:hypothetical protein
MCNKIWQLDKRQRCWLMGGGTATTGGGGSIKGGDAGGQEATQKPAKQERLNKRWSRQTGGYATTS